MDLIIDMMQRDQRTVKSISSQSACGSENCDKTDKASRINLTKKFNNKNAQHHREFRYTLHHFLIITLIVIMSSGEASARPAKSNQFQTSEPPVYDHKCYAIYNKTSLITRQQLQARIKELLTECNVVLNSTKLRADAFINAIFNSSNTTIDEHHKANNDDRPHYRPNKLSKIMEFRKEIGNIEEFWKLKDEPNDAVYKNKVYEHLEKIYQRFDHLEAVVLMLENYANEHSQAVVYDHRKKDVTSFFENAKTDFERILCHIKGIVSHLYRVTDGDKGRITVAYPEKHDVKFDYWYMYREYETIVDYSYQMLNAILNGDTSNSNEG